MKPLLLKKTFLQCIISLAILACLATTKREILTASYPPVTDCSLNDTLNPDLVVGIEVNILRQALTNVNWTEGVDYYFNCTTWDDIFYVIPGYTRPVLGAINGITISGDRLSSGLRFSEPTMSTGMSLLYKRESEAVFYIRSFDTSFLLLLIFLPIILGLFIYAFQGCKMGITNYIYYVLTIYFKVDDLSLLNLESRLIALSVKTMMLIVLVLYTAFTTNNLALDNDYGGVQSVSNLRGLKVATISYYADTVYSQGSIYQYFPNVWTTEDFVTQIDLTNASYIAYDAPVVSYVAYLECNLYTVLPNFYKYDFGVMMPQQVDPNDELLVNIGLTQAFMNKTQTDWTNEYFNTTLTDGCKSKPVLSLPYIAFADVKGLWYIWGVGVGIATGVMVLQLLRRLIRKKKNQYDFTGVRAEADQRIRAKFSALLAVHSATSVGDIELEKKELHTIYAKVIDEMKLDEKILLRISDTLAKDQDFNNFKHYYNNTSANMLNIIKEKKVSFLRSIWMKILKRGTTTASDTTRSSRFAKAKLPNLKLVSPNLEGPNLSLLPPDTNRRQKEIPAISSRLASDSIQMIPPIQRKHVERQHRLGSIILENIRNSDYLNSLINRRAQRHRGSKTSLMGEIFGIPGKDEKTFLKQINAEIMKIYKISSCMIDSAMLESAVDKMAHSKTERKNKFQNNYGLGKEFDFLMTRRNGILRSWEDNPVPLSIANRHNNSLIISPNSSIVPRPRKKFSKFAPNSRGPSNNILNHLFTSRSFQNLKSPNSTLRFDPVFAPNRPESPNGSIRIESPDATLVLK